MKHYIGIVGIEKYPYKKAINVYGQTTLEVKAKYEAYVNIVGGCIDNCYPMDNAQNQKLYGDLCKIIPSI